MSGSSEKAHRREVRRALGEQVGEQFDVLLNEGRVIRSDLALMKEREEALGMDLLRTRSRLAVVEGTLSGWQQWTFWQRLRWLVGGWR